MMLVSMNQSPKARMPLEERIQTEFLHIWKWGPGSGSQGTDWCAEVLRRSCLSSPSASHSGSQPCPSFFHIHQIQLRKPCITGDWEFCKSKGPEDRNQELENLDGKRKFLCPPTSNWNLTFVSIRKIGSKPEVLVPVTVSVPGITDIHMLQIPQSIVICTTTWKLR